MENNVEKNKGEDESKQGKTGWKIIIHNTETVGNHSKQRWKVTDDTPSIFAERPICKEY